MQTIIETKDLTKKFGSFTAVDQLSIKVGKGEIYGFLGLNGAGKTTTIRMLLGMIRQTAGNLCLNGHPVHSESRVLWDNVGYLVEIPYSYPELTVWENLEIVRRLRFIADIHAVDSVIEKLHLGQYRDKKAQHLSLGNAQRLGLAKAIMHNPAILILDEPANGLDPAGIVEIRKLLMDLAYNHGATVFVSSHILGEISRLATRIGIIHNGMLIQELGAGQLETFRKKRLILHVHENLQAMSMLAKEGYEIKAMENGSLEIAGKDAIEFPEKVNTLLVKAGNPPSMLKVEEEDLEAYFLRAIGRNGGDL
jgi:ABC-2 type transport system ATP-binding protein